MIYKVVLTYVHLCTKCLDTEGVGRCPGVCTLLSPLLKVKVFYPHQERNDLR